jgi:hypothetical protein
MAWKIYHKTSGLWSNGIIQEGYYTSGPTGTRNRVVRFSKKGKEWKTEKGVKDHLLKWLLFGNAIPKEWEIVEVVYAPTKPMEEWLDAKMTLALLKNTGK